jgi:hypothetical protein
MDVNDILARLNKVKANGDDSWLACCPAHDDTNPSLSVGVKGGKILLHCHAGCDNQSIVDALGLKMSDLMPDDGKREERFERGAKKQAAKAEKKSPVKTYECSYYYHDDKGQAIYKVDRFRLSSGGKTFVQMRRDDDVVDGWSYGLSGGNVKRVPYHLPHILAAGKAGKQVVIFEGEKDVDNYRVAIGGVATCNAAGAGKWERGWGDYFKGVTAILIVADNDPETIEKTKRGKKVVESFAAGQKHACDVEAKLRADGYDGKIKKMVMPPVDGNKVKDFSDWFQAHIEAGRTEFRDLFAAAVKDAAEWPEKWNFGDVVAVDNGDAEDKEEKEKPRFGVILPRSPSENVNVVRVDFGISPTIEVELDIDGGKSVAENVRIAIAAALEKCPDNQMPRGMAVRLKVWVVALWFLARGKFFWNIEDKRFESAMYIETAGDAKLMIIESDEFCARIAAVARFDGVDAKKAELNKVLNLLRQIAFDSNYSTGVVPASMWVREKDAIYISSGDDRMYRIKNGAIENVVNGTDGVVFLKGKTLAPWVLVDKVLDPLENALIFTGAAWRDKSGPMNIRLWMLNLFAGHVTKPMLLIMGLAQSGKTRMAKAIKEILGVRVGDKLDVSLQKTEDGEKGEEAFWVTVNEGKLEVFDNLDTKVKWVGDALQNASTDGQVKRRLLYSSRGVVMLRANAHLIITSNNPMFTTEGAGGMADRLIGVHLLTNRGTSLDTELSVDIAVHRNQYMSWFAKVLAKVLMDNVPVEESLNERHPDYGKFCVKIGRAIGDVDGVLAALGSAEADKGLMPLQNDHIAREILKVFEYKDYQYTFTSGEMAMKIIELLGDDADDKSVTVYTAKKIGRTLVKYWRQFNIIFNMAPVRMLNGKSVYEVKGLTAAGRSQVGLVGFNNDFGKNIYARNKNTFPENARTNPLNPLDSSEGTRARG